MEILIIGGTRFLGKILSDKFITSKKVNLTVLSRNPIVNGFDCNVINMNRNKGLKILKNKFFNLIFDFLVFDVNDIIEIRKLNFSKYIFISTSWVNKLNKKNSIDKLIIDLDQKLANNLSPLTKKYLLGKRKAENKLFELLDEDKFHILRLPIFFGVNDHTNRFSFYLSRLLNNDNLILVDSGENICQIAYAEDLAKVLFLFSERLNIKETIINALPHKGMKVIEFISLIKKSINSNSKLLKIDRSILKKSFPEYLEHEPLWNEKLIDIGRNNIFNIFNFKSTETEDWINKLTSSIGNNYSFSSELRIKEIKFINELI